MVQVGHCPECRRPLAMFASHGCHDGSVCGADAECFDCLLDCRDAQIRFLKLELQKRLTVEDRWNERHRPNYQRLHPEPRLPRYTTRPA